MWAEDLAIQALAPQLEDMAQIDPGDFGHPLPEYGQLPKMTNAEARELFKFQEDPPGVTKTMTKVALGTTSRVNRSFIPSFGETSLLKSRIATALTTPINPAFVAPKHKMGAV
jgi:hypothetical protein